MQTAGRELPRSAADIPLEVYTQPDPHHGEELSKPPHVARVEGSGGAMPGPPPGPAPPHQMCVVCQRAIDYHSAVKKLVCTHMCHADCADRWLREELHCPLCKNQVLFPMAEPSILHGGVVPPTRVEGPLPAVRAVPLDGTRSRDYGICRDCQQVFYRNPTVVRPETNAYYRCPNCRSYDVVDMIRASCAVQ